MSQFLSNLKANVDPKRGPKGLRMRDSYVTDFLPFKSNPSSLGIYYAQGGGIRMGVMLEELDNIAGMVSLAHALTVENKDDLQAVTASLDRIDMLQPFPSNRDLKVSGICSYVGNSSMEVSIKVQSLPEDVSIEDARRSFDIMESTDEALKADQTLVLTAKFIMVAIHRITHKPITVPKLILESKEEHDLFRKGAEHKARKQIAAGKALSKTPPSTDELQSIHSIFLESVKYSNGSLPLPPNNIWMKDTEYSALILTHPKDTNIYQNIFGGYLMREGFELAYSTALMFTKSASVEFVSVDDIMFNKPVPVGSLLSLHSRVIYSPGHPSKTFQISVYANVVDPSTGKTETTNTFNFTFSGKPGVKIPRVLPESYEESVANIDGFRKSFKGYAS